MRRPDPYRKGGPHDDVARNIRNEQRADAAPSPEEAREMHREYLREEGCEVCGEDDPDRLESRPPYVAPCRFLQRAGIPDPTVLCEDHQRTPTELWWAETLTRAIEANAAAIVRYECDNVHLAETPTIEVPAKKVGHYRDGPVYEYRTVEDRRQAPTAPLECPCGEGVAEVVYL